MKNTPNSSLPHRHAAHAHSQCQAQLNSAVSSCAQCPSSTSTLNLPTTNPETTNLSHNKPAYSLEKLNSTSKFLSLILRHKPETIGISLDEHGWADVQDLLKGINKTHPIDLAILEKIVATDNKQRYSFNEDHSKIRANQGHSIHVDVELKTSVPPDTLYHGTAERFVSSILRQGLLPSGRLYVHLSKDKETALSVGKRHGKPVVFRIDSKTMHQDGLVFYLSANGVWLTQAVPTKYLQQL